MFPVKPSSEFPLMAAAPTFSSAEEKKMKKTLPVIQDLITKVMKCTLIIFDLQNSVTLITSNGFYGLVLFHYKTKKK